MALNDIITVRNRNIFQSNDIMGVTYWLLNGENEKYRLNVNQTKILKIVMAMVNPRETLQEEYTFYDSEFMEIIGIENQTAQYIDIPEFLNDVMKNDTFKSIDSNGNIKIIHMFDHVEYNPKEKKIKFAFSNGMLKGLTNLDGNYTKYRLGNILNFKSLYSINLYELFKKELKGNKNKNISIDIDKLKEWLGLNDKYSRYYDFKNKVLDKVKDEINLLNDIRFDYSEIRKGKKVIAIKFNITNMNKTKNEVAATIEERHEILFSDNIKIVKAIIQEDITDMEAKQILDVANGELGIIKEKYKIAKITPNIKNIVSWMKKAIRDNYQYPISKNNRDTFSNYEQRTYDFPDLERKLLDWDIQTDEITVEEYQQEKIKVD